MEDLRSGFTYIIRKTENGYFGFVGECDKAVTTNANSIDELVADLNVKIKREEGEGENILSAESQAKNLRKIKSSMNMYLTWAVIDKKIKDTN